MEGEHINSTNSVYCHGQVLWFGGMHNLLFPATHKDFFCLKIRNCTQTPIKIVLRSTMQSKDPKKSHMKSKVLQESYF